MTEFERQALVVARQHFMADAEDPVLDFDKGMEMLSLLLRGGGEARLRELMSEARRNQPGAPATGAGAPS